MQKLDGYGAYARKVYATEICIFDNNEVTVDGARQIMEYSSGNVKICLGRSIVNIVGDGLCIRNLSCQKLVVSGCVLQVDFCKI